MAGLAFGPDGNLFVASRETDAVLRYDGQTGLLMDEFANGGGLRQPSDIVFGPSGALFVSSWGSDEILRFQFFTNEVKRYDIEALVWSYLHSFGAADVRSACEFLFGGTSAVIEARNGSTGWGCLSGPNSIPNGRSSPAPLAKVPSSSPLVPSNLPVIFMFRLLDSTT